MISRLISLLVLLYALGFVLFAFTLGRPAAANAPHTDAVVVLTGGPGRIEQAVSVLRRHEAGRMLVSGTDPTVTKGDLAARIPNSSRLFACCADLDSVSVDTHSNAEEAHRWILAHQYRSVRLITSDWHIRRARYEFRKELGSKFQIIPDAVATEPSFFRLFGEYNKYVLRRLTVFADFL